MWKDIFQSSLQTMDNILLAKVLCDRVYFWGIFHAIGYRVWRDLPHIPVTSLSSTTPPPGALIPLNIR